MLGIDDIDWLAKDHSNWESAEGFQKLKSFVVNVLVTNDLAERGVQLMTDFIDKTEDETERQALLQVVEFQRKQYPTLRKRPCKN